MPLTLVELYRAETGPICPNRGLPPAPSPAGFCIRIYGIIKVNSPFPSFGQLSLGGFQIALQQQELLSFSTTSPEVPGEFSPQSY